MRSGLCLFELKYKNILMLNEEAFIWHPHYADNFFPQSIVDLGHTVLYCFLSFFNIATMPVKTRSQN